MRNPQDPTRLVVVDGVAQDAAAPALAADLPGVLRGEGIFETFLVREGVPSAFLGLHDQRLRESARLCGFDLQGRGLLEALDEILPHVREGAWRVRYTVLRAPEGGLVRLWTAGDEPPPRSEVVLAVSEFRTDPAYPLAAAKTISRIGWQVARQRAAAAGAFDCILPTVDGDLAECTSANLFVVQDGRIATPGLDRGILDGVTRRTLLAACAEAGIALAEERVPLEALAAADEVWVSNAVIGVVPASAILEHREDLPGGAGASLAAVRTAYRDYLDRAAAHDSAGA